jgi:hypothetical protein
MKNNITTAQPDASRMSKVFPDFRKHFPPAVVTATVSVHYSFWDRYGERLAQLERECPHVYVVGKDSKDSPHLVEHTARDVWGCLWHHPGGGITGQVVEHPLDDWAKFNTWQPPSPDTIIADIYRKAAARTEDDPNEAWHGGLDHNFVFLRMGDLRGFDNFMMDVAEDNPLIYELCDIVTDYWCQITRAYVDSGAVLVGAGDDLGMQDRLPISPEAWRKLIKPAYHRIFSITREHDAWFALHTDGCIVDIIPDLIEVGVTQLNPQDTVNGLENLARLAKGKVHIALDIDRQYVTTFGTPAEVDAHIEKCIRTLGSPQGGLDLVYGAWPGTPIENIEATLRAVEKYHDMWL